MKIINKCSFKKSLAKKTEIHFNIELNVNYLRRVMNLRHLYNFL